MEHDKNRAAVRAAKEASFGEDAMSGGFNIMKQLVRKQHKKQKIRKK